MTREETVGLVRSIVDLYPNWKPNNLTETVNTWHWALEEYPAPAIKAALQIYLKTNNTGFAPSVSQLISSMYKPNENGRLTEGEAWALVKKAISDSAYSAKERFEELPPEIRKAVGGPEMLRQWGMTDSDEVNTVIMSNFQRTYKAVLSQKEYSERVPASVNNLIQELTSKTSPEGRKGIETQLQRG